MKKIFKYIKNIIEEHSTIINLIIAIIIIIGPILAIYLQDTVLCIFKKKDNAVVYLQYLGSLIGGFATLRALYVTVRETRKIQQENYDLNINQIYVNNINEEIKDYSNILELVTVEKNSFGRVINRYERKSEWKITDAEDFLYEINEIKDKIANMDKNPLLISIGCSFNEFFEQYRKIVEAVHGLDLYRSANNYNIKIIMKDCKNISVCVEQFIVEKIKIHLNNLYNDKYKILKKKSERNLKQ